MPTGQARAGNRKSLDRERRTRLGRSQQDWPSRRPSDNVLLPAHRPRKRPGTSTGYFAFCGGLLETGITFSVCWIARYRCLVLCFIVCIRPARLAAGPLQPHGGRARSAGARVGNLCCWRGGERKLSRRTAHHNGGAQRAMEPLPQARLSGWSI